MSNDNRAAALVGGSDAPGMPTGCGTAIAGNTGGEPPPRGCKGGR